MKEYQHRFLFSVTTELRPHVKLQAVFRYRVAVLGRKVFPYTEPRRLNEVGERAHWRFVRWAITVLGSKLVRMGIPCVHTLTSLVKNIVTISR